MLLEAALAAAISTRAPHLHQEQVTTYAEIITEQSKQKELDPWLFFAIVDTESRWYNRVLHHEKIGGCSVGLAGIYTKKCDPNTVAKLYDPATNLTTSATLQKVKKEWCKVHKCRGDWLLLYNRSSVYVQRVRRLAETTKHVYSP